MLCHFKKVSSSRFQKKLSIFFHGFFLQAAVLVWQRNFRCYFKELRRNEL